MILNYVYDGSFEGLLTAVYDAYYKKENPQAIITQDQVTNNFLVEYIYIKTDEEKFNSVYEAVDSKISSLVLRRIFYCYLSELPGLGRLILDYIYLGFKLGPRVDENLANDVVRNIDNMYKKVSRERHRMLGLLRFKKVENGVLYARVEPDHNVVGLIAPHFARRMRGEHWVIHDVGRNIGIIYDGEEWTITDIDVSDSLLLREEEEDYQNLWKTYFNAISIEGKTNPRLQRNHMPKRYWKHLVEK